MDMQSTLATCKAAATSISEKLYLVQQSMKNLHTVHADYKTILSSLRFWFFAMQKCLVVCLLCNISTHGQNAMFNDCEHTQHLLGCPYSLDWC